MRGEYAVLKILKDNAAVAAIVGSRVYLDEAPQNAQLPYVIVSEEDVEPFDTDDGKSVMDKDIVRVFPYAATKISLRSLSVSCRDALDHVAPGPYNLELVELIVFENQTSFDEEIENRKVYAKDQQYSVWVSLFGVTADRTDITADSTEVTADSY